MELNRHKDWLIRVIKSCETREQLESCMTLIRLFLQKLTLGAVPVDQQTIRNIESELLQAHIDRESVMGFI